MEKADILVPWDCCSRYICSEVSRRLVEDNANHATPICKTGRDKLGEWDADINSLLCLPNMYDCRRILVRKKDGIGK